jgi:spore germination protein YaaH
MYRPNFLYTRIIVLVAFFVSVSFSVPLGEPSGVEAKATVYRVYQKTQALQEFVTLSQAIAYAKKFSFSYVEQISTRQWAWHNFPRYRVYQRGMSAQDWQFATLQEAIREAKKWKRASVRDVTRGGWVWDNYPDANFSLFQGGLSLPTWQFRTLKEAQKEADKWKNAYIMELETNRWVWDNMRLLRPNEKSQTFRIEQNGRIVQTYNLKTLREAIAETNRWENSLLKSNVDDRVVYANNMPYVVSRNGKKLASFAGLRRAISYASTLQNVSIQDGGQTLWSSVGYYQVMQNKNVLAMFSTPEKAIEYAKKYASSSLVTPDGVRLWSNDKSLRVLGWHGMSNPSTIVTQIQNTQGLDWSSPTWFVLADAAGNVTDASHAQTATWLQQKGIKVMPLVHNQFNASMTTAFLADDAAQKRFITTVIDRLVALNVEGINIDFESISGKDRQRYTAFVQAFSKAAKKKKLIVSIDLPRGDASWNMRSAYDRQAIAQEVDYIALMAYDQFYRLSKSPGPVAGMSWTEGGITQLLDEGIPRKKVLLGIPYYVRVFEIDDQQQVIGTRAVLLKDVDRLLQENAATVTSAFDPTYGLLKVTYVQAGKRYVFWKEDADTVMKRIALAQKYDLAGVAVWRLGYEPGSLWQRLLRVTASSK